LRYHYELELGAANFPELLQIEELVRTIRRAMLRQQHEYINPLEFQLNWSAVKDGISLSWSKKPPLFIPEAERYKFGGVKGEIIAALIVARLENSLPPNFEKAEDELTTGMQNEGNLRIRFKKT